MVDEYVRNVLKTVRSDQYQAITYCYLRGAIDQVVRIPDKRLIIPVSVGNTHTRGCELTYRVLSVYRRGGGCQNSPVKAAEGC